MQGSIFSCLLKVASCTEEENFLQFLSAVEILDIFPKDFSMHSSIQTFLTSVSERGKKPKQISSSAVVYKINSDLNMSNKIIFL